LSVSPVLPSKTDSNPALIVPDQANQPPDAGIDPVTGLHRMSYIAGLGTHEYVSINIPAVVAALLGVASCLAVIWGWMIFLPIAGVVCGVLAMTQISRSNGTQTGTQIAWIGLALSGLFLLIAGGQRVMDARQLTVEGQKISDLCQQWGQDIAANDFDKAYKLYSDRFTDSVSLDEFKTRMHDVQTSDVYTGPIVSAQWNGLAQFDSESNTGVVTASGMILINYKLGMSDRWRAFFRLVNGHWQIDSMPDVFTEQKAPR
jgi:hypothetical protein